MTTRATPSANSVDDPSLGWHGSSKNPFSLSSPPPISMHVWFSRAGPETIGYKRKRTKQQLAASRFMTGSYFGCSRRRETTAAGRLNNTKSNLKEKKAWSSHANALKNQMRFTTMSYNFMRVIEEISKTQSPDLIHPSGNKYTKRHWERERRRQERQVAL